MTGEDFYQRGDDMGLFFNLDFPIASVLHADGCIATAISTLHSLGVVSNFCLGFVLHFKCGLIYLASSKHERYFFAV
jgi:hypothetical protein